MCLLQNFVNEISFIAKKKKLLFFKFNLLLSHSPHIHYQSCFHRLVNFHKVVASLVKNCIDMQEDGLKGTGDVHN